MKLPVKLLLLIVVLFVLRLVVGLGTAAYHYNNTQTYSEYLQNHEVTPAYFQSQVALPTPLHRGTTWQQGMTADADWEKNDQNYLGGAKIEINIDHGEDLMLQLEQDVEYLIDSTTNEHLGFQWSTPVLRTGVNLRAVVLVWLDEDALKLGPGSAKAGKATVDAFLLAGADRSEIYYLDRNDRDAAFAGQTLGLPIHPNFFEDGPAVEFPLWRALTGIVNHFGEPPTEGLIHFATNRVNFDWEKRDRTMAHGGHYRPATFVNTDEYSYRTRCKVSALHNRSHSHSTTHEISKTQEWNDRIW